MVPVQGKTFRIDVARKVFAIQQLMGEAGSGRRRDALFPAESFCESLVFEVKDHPVKNLRWTCATAFFLFLIVGGGGAAPCEILAWFGVETNHQAHVSSPCQHEGAEHDGCDCCEDEVDAHWLQPVLEIKIPTVSCVAVKFVPGEENFSRPESSRILSGKPPDGVPRSIAPPFTGRFLI